MTSVSGMLANHAPIDFHLEKNRDTSSIISLILAGSEERERYRFFKWILAILNRIAQL
jgi:hypothetical protein